MKGQNLQALVDIGSNGVRFSISELSPPTTRITPTVFQDRSGLSLYDAQHSTGTILPIPSTIIEELLAALLRFKEICRDFGVQDENIRVLATEATRNAINRNELLHHIKEKTGWDVRLLAKEEEGRLGAMGIASSVTHLDGICIDMGGGSVQLTWMKKNPHGDVDMGPSVSFPYGAAALMSRLSTASDYEKGKLLEELTTNIQQILKRNLQIPMSRWEAAKLNGGFNLYLSGGGLRGLGHILMSQEPAQPYPIPIINGYTVSGAQFFSAPDLGLIDSTTFRISSRRASQLPAVIQLVEALKQAQISISQATFAQGGIREGLLYSELPPSIRAQHPLVASTATFAPPSAATISKLLRDGLPYPLEPEPYPLGPELLEATVNLLYHHRSLSKDIRAGAALRCTTTGILAGVHGLSHRERSVLGLILCERWGGDISAVDATIFDSFQRLSGPLCWWAKFIGRMAKGIADLHPAGVVRDEQALSIQAGFPGKRDEMSDSRLEVYIRKPKGNIDHVTKAWARSLEKIGKKKNWPLGKGGFTVDVMVVTDTT